jgi:hypothetical protein
MEVGGPYQLLSKHLYNQDIFKVKISSQLAHHSINVLVLTKKLTFILTFILALLLKLCLTLDWEKNVFFVTIYIYIVKFQEQ